jgi:hypothetical protein
MHKTITGVITDKPHFEVFMSNLCFHLGSYYLVL